MASEGVRRLSLVLGLVGLGVWLVPAGIWVYIEVSGDIDADRATALHSDSLKVGLGIGGLHQLSRRQFNSKEDLGRELKVIHPELTYLPPERIANNYLSHYPGQVTIRERRGGDSVKVLLVGMLPAFLLPWGLVRGGAQVTRVVGWIAAGFRTKPPGG
jgi:hypothetical protein